MRRRLYTFLCVSSVMIALIVVNFHNKKTALYSIHYDQLNTSPAFVPKPYEGRLSGIKRMCTRFRNQFNEKRISLRRYIGLTFEDRPHLFFSDKYKILVCNVGKCGSTQWRKLLVKLENNYTEMTELQYMSAWRKRRLWEQHDASTNQGYFEAERKVNDYYRIMTVREPLERLVSAYKNKLEHFNEKKYAQMSKEIHTSYGNGSGRFATFSEFVDSILDEKIPKHLDAHWRPFTLTCDPCHFNFDIIAKLETINEDFSFIASKLNIRRDSAFAHNSNRLDAKWKSSYHDYFATLTQYQRSKIFEYYKTQYDYFGYPYPDFI